MWKCLVVTCTWHMLCLLFCNNNRLSVANDYDCILAMLLGSIRNGRLMVTQFSVPTTSWNSQCYLEGCKVEHAKADSTWQPNVFCNTSYNDFLILSPFVQEELPIPLLYVMHVILVWKLKPFTSCALTLVRSGDRHIMNTGTHRILDLSCNQEKKNTEAWTAQVVCQNIRFLLCF